MTTKFGGLIGSRLGGEVTSKRMATDAGKTLRSKNSTPKEKRLAGGLLTQVPPGGYGKRKP